MKSLKITLAGLCLLAAGAFAVTACGPSDQCSSDSDCSGTEVCWKGGSGGGQCLVNCGEAGGGEAACKDSEQCVSVSSGKKGCAPADQIDNDAGGDVGVDGDEGDTGMEPDTNGGGGENPYFVAVKDITKGQNTDDRDSDGTADGEQMCNAGDSSEGADVFGIELLNEQGNSQAWATAVVGNVTGGSTKNKIDTVFDGTKPSLVDSPDADDGNSCPGSGGSTEFSNSTVVSLGCGGSVVVGFKDSNDEWIPIKSGMRVVVYEYAKACFKHSSDGKTLKCKPGDDPVGCAIEHVELFKCNATDSPMSQAGDLQAATVNNNGNFPKCTTSVSTGKGVVPIDASL